MDKDIKVKYTIGNGRAHEEKFNNYIDFYYFIKDNYRKIKIFSIVDNNYWLMLNYGI